MQDHIELYCDKDRGFFIDKRTGDLFRLNPVGALILNAKKAGKSETAIIEEICREFSVNANEAAADFQKFSERLKEQEIFP